MCNGLFHRGQVVAWCKDLLPGSLTLRYPGVRFRRDGFDAGVVESADTQDLKSCVIPMACGFKSRLPHQKTGQPVTARRNSMCADFPLTLTHETLGPRAVHVLVQITDSSAV